MPNHCFNELRLFGDITEIKRLLKVARTKNAHGDDVLFTFNAFIPMPPNIYRGSIGVVEKKHYPGSLNRCGWSIEHWGTKSDCWDVEIYTQVIRFVTAWTPPVPVIKAISKQFPTLDIEFFAEEPEMNQLEDFVMKNGIIL